MVRVIQKHEHERAPLEGDPPSDGATSLFVSILVLEDRPLVRDCLVAAIGAAWPQARLHATGLDEEPRDLSDRIFDVILLGSGAEQRSDRILTAIQQARTINADAPIIVMSDNPNSTLVAVATEAGARGVLTSVGTTLPVAISILKLVHAGGTYLPALPSRGDRAGLARGGTNPDDRLSLALFTDREVDILTKIADGKPNKIIAYELGICESTTKIHIRHIMRKTTLTNRTQVALLARELLDEGRV